MARIATRQHGVVSTHQLLAAGLGRGGISRRVRSGRLHQVYRGVYAVGHAALSLHGRWMAAVLACRRGAAAVEDAGDTSRMERADDGFVATPAVGRTTLELWGAALSHRSAAGLWGLLSTGDERVDVTIPGDGGKKSRRGIRMHRSVSLSPAFVTLRAGIPVTTPARTVADLRRAGSGRGGRRLISQKELRRAIRQADVLGLPIGPDIDRDRTRSDLERAFLRICRRHRLPAPEVNVRIGRHLVDFLWRGRRLIVETDGYRYHRGRTAFEDDRDRDLDLRALGYEVVRLSGRQVLDEPVQVASVLKAVLRGRQ